jgi:hypothetical protein
MGSLRGDTHGVITLLEDDVGFVKRHRVASQLGRGGKVDFVLEIPCRIVIAIGVGWVPAINFLR